MPVILPPGIVTNPAVANQNTIQPTAEMLGILRLRNAAGTGGGAALGEILKVNSALDAANLAHVVLDSPNLLLALGQRYATLKVISTITDTAPAGSAAFAALDLSGRYGATGTLGTLYGIFCGARLTAAGTVTNLTALEMDNRVTTAGATATTMRGLHMLSPTLTGAGATIGACYGVAVETLGRTGITNASAVRIEAQAGAATTNYAIQSLGGQSLLLAGAAATMPLVLQGAAAQSAPHLEIQDSSARALLDLDSLANLLMSRVDSTSVSVPVAKLTAEFNVNTHASYTGRLKISAQDFGGLREGMRLEGTGTAAALGFFGAAAVVQQTGASAAGIAAIIDPNAKAAVAALQTALANLGLITSPA